MSDEQSSAPPPAIQQQQLVQQIAGLLVQSYAESWTELRYEVSSLIGYQESILLGQLNGAQLAPDWPPHEVADVVRDLRSVMYRPGAGTWFSAVITVDRARAVSAEFNYDQAPPWDTEPVAEAYAQDIRKFPRDDAATPTWLRDRLDEAAAEAPVLQQQFLEEIARVLTGSQPPGAELRYEVSSLAGYMEDGLYVTGEAGGVTCTFAPEAVIDLVDELRAVMYRRHTGTWFFAVITVDGAGTVSAEFNYDEAPPWETEPVAEAYAQDIRKFPRDDAATPAWLRDRLDEAASEREHPAG